MAEAHIADRILGIKRKRFDGLFTDHERLEIDAMVALKERSEGPLCRPIGEWLVRMAMRTWPRWAGLRFFKKTNVRRRWVLVSFHHPARLCWSWSLSVSLFQRTWGKGFHRFFSSYRGNWNARLPWLIELSWHRQTYDWMLSSNAKRRLMAAAMRNTAEAA